MYKINLEKLLSLVDKYDKSENSGLTTDNSKENEDYARNLLKETIKELCQYVDYTEKVVSDKVLKESSLEFNRFESSNEDLPENLKKSLWLDSDVNAINEVVTVILKKDQKEFENEFFPIVPIDKNSSRIIFIDEDYEKLRLLIGDDSEEQKIFTGLYTDKNNTNSNRFRYRLSFDDSFIKAEYLLQCLNRYYKVNNPIVLSPLSRKAFVVSSLDELPDDCIIDYRFEENGLKIIEKSFLFWNIKTEKIEIPSCASAPFGNNTKYKYEFKLNKNGTHCFVVPEDSNTFVYDVVFTDDETILWTDKQIDNFIKVEIIDIDLNKDQIKSLAIKERLFSNQVKKGAFQTRRIVSEGDLERALYPFRHLDSIGLECSLENSHIPDENIILRYSSKYRTTLLPKIGYKKLKKGYVKFSFANNHKYISDYVNYVLMYLDYFYPEITWIGCE